MNKNYRYEKEGSIFSLPSCLSMKEIHNKGLRATKSPEFRPILFQNGALLWLIYLHDGLLIMPFCSISMAAANHPPPSVLF